MTGGSVWKQEETLGNGVMRIATRRKERTWGEVAALRRKPESVSKQVVWFFSLRRDLRVCVGQGKFAGKEHNYQQSGENKINKALEKHRFETIRSEKRIGEVQKFKAEKRQLLPDSPNQFHQN